MKIGDTCIFYPSNLARNVYINCIHDSIIYTLKCRMFFGTINSRKSFYSMMVETDHIMTNIKSIEYENR